MSVRVQIAGVSSIEEALAIERFGGDAVGLTVRLPNGIHDGLTEAKARAIAAALPPFISSVAITYVGNPREALDLCRYLGVQALQLHGDFPDRELDFVRAGAPHLKILRAVHVVDESALDHAKMLERRVDAIILDSVDPVSGRRGATGLTHDWEISRRIVAASRVPVILAGGLTPENVADAIRHVRPWAVDVHTGVESDGGRRDFHKLEAFLRNAKQAS